jgi:hypothetical protein
MRTCSNPQLFKTYQFGSSGGFLTLTIASTTTTATWSGTAGSNWGQAGAGGNWSNGAAPGAAGDTAIFPSTASSFIVNLNNAGAQPTGPLARSNSTAHVLHHQPGIGRHAFP